MLVTSCVNHVLSLRNLISALLVKHLSSTCSEPPSVLILVLRAMAQTKISLKDLMALKSQKIHDYSQTSIEELGQIKVAVGRKYKGVSFAEIYLDDSYNKWVADHVKENPCSPQGVELYAHYLRRRLEMEIKDQVDLSKPIAKDPPPQASKRTKESMAASSTGHQIPVPESPFEDKMGSWSQMTDMEENMTQMKDRMLTLESMVGQVLQYLQHPQQAALADPQGASPQDP